MSDATFILLAGAVLAAATLYAGFGPRRTRCPNCRGCRTRWDGGLGPGSRRCEDCSGSFDDARQLFAFKGGRQVSYQELKKLKEEIKTWAHRD